MARGPLFETVDDVDLVVVERHEFLTPGQTTLVLILSSDDVDLSVENADPEIGPFRFH